VETLASLAGGQSVLELGIGTGRVALPLAMKGLHVSGIDCSEKMLNQLRKKNGADRISIISGNFADVPVEGRFDLIYVVGWSFSYLLTQSQQIRCFRNVGQKLTERGKFVIETIAPTEWMLRKAGFTSFVSDTLIMHGAAVDLAQQLVKLRYLRVGTEDVKTYSERIRFIWPSEFDLLAEIAGLQLDALWSNWSRDPFPSESGMQILVYGPKIS
jgi:cyclopropane fatty-acyl-phospholipid synthase-like methyltransferase